jgi:hypothetical protein
MLSHSRLLLVSVIGFGVLYVAAVVALGTPPAADDSGRQVAAWFRDHDGNTRAFVWLLTLAGPLFATAAVLIRERLPSPHRDVFLFGAIALGVETAVQAWIWAGLSWHADRLAPATARTLLDVASFWGPVLTGATFLMLVPVAVAVLGGASDWPRWIGLLSAFVALEQAIETITIFGHTGFIAPGGPMNTYVGAALFALWLLCVGVTAARRPDVSLITSGRSPGRSTRDVLRSP